MNSSTTTASPGSIIVSNDLQIASWLPTVTNKSKSTFGLWTATYFCRKINKVSKFVILGTLNKIPFR
jgi:hypothetical protein